jgi:hypothetical protein
MSITVRNLRGLTSMVKLAYHRCRPEIEVGFGPERDGTDERLAGKSGSMVFDVAAD